MLVHTAGAEYGTGACSFGRGYKQEAAQGTWAASATDGRLERVEFSVLDPLQSTENFEHPIQYRGNGPLRNREFLIWAKGEGGVSPARTPIFKKQKAT